MIRSMLQDVRHAFRQIRRRPRFAALAIGTLALGIGAATAIFAVTDAILLRPLPYADADRLAVVWEHSLPREVDRNPVASANFVAWKEQARGFERLAGLETRSMTLAGRRGAFRVDASAVTPEFFDLFGARPMLGRTFDRAEAEREERVVVLSWGLWQRLFGGDSAAVGRTVRVEGEVYQVIGILPRDFEAPSFPVLWFTLEPAELWLPLRPVPEYQGRGMVVFGKLAPAVSYAEAQAEMAAIAGRLAAEHEYAEGWSANVVPLHEQVVGEARTPLIVLLGAVGFLLLIACANVASLLLARATERREELAVRAALGADRGRLFRQVLSESLLVAGLAGALGWGLAWWGTRAVVLLHPEGIPRAGEVALDARVLVVAIAVSVITAALSGLAPALRAGRRNVAELVGGGRRTIGRPSDRSRRLLIAGEVALALALLAGAGLLGRSLLHLRAVDPGFEAESRLSFRVALPDEPAMEVAERTDFFAGLVRRVEAVPGVRAAAAAFTLPFAGIGIGTSFLVEDHPDPGRANRPVADVVPVTPGYFRALGIPLIEGRDFEAGDRPDAPRPYIVNEALARAFWPGESALGKEVQVSLGEMLPGRVVGVVEDVRLKELGEPARATIYMPHAFLPADGMYVVVHASGDPEGLIGPIRDAVRTPGLDLPLHDIAPMTSRLDGSLAAERFRSTLLAAFAGLALLLTLVGLYGVVSHAVGQRTREIAVRMAVGARRQDIVGDVLRESLLMALLGVAGGLLAVVLLGRFLEGLLFGLDPLDPATLLATAAALLATALLAAWLPARRAARLDPLVALRKE